MIYKGKERRMAREIKGTCTLHVTIQRSAQMEGDQSCIVCNYTQVSTYGSEIKAAICITMQRSEKMGGRQKL